MCGIDIDHGTHEELNHIQLNHERPALEKGSISLTNDRCARGTTNEGVHTLRGHS